MRPRFLTNDVDVRFKPDGRNVTLLTDVVFRDSRGRVWRAMAGKETDGASIPRFLWPWLGGPYEGLHRDGALLHDDAAYLLAPAGESSWTGALWSSERAAADEMIWEATMVRIQQAGLGWLPHLHEVAKADAIYDGLRLFGFKAWADHASQNKEKTWLR